MGRLLRTKTIKYIFIKSRRGRRRRLRQINHFYCEPKPDNTWKWIIGGVLTVAGVIILYFWWQYIVGLLVLLLILGALAKGKRK